ncbi:hypothetical protein [Caldanaerobacter subterraneus]|uniref:Uncharacterized protein n=1 Tax=Caldanaerobacter subterraneus TaxID=911092 RepID=A0A4R2JZY7_9THEO|nr:hypothetical protein [Caldanaerobacter subterraneus]TCO66253.1 hypothetical protein EV203_11131 [Caldanaerobacter subterraneus]
MKRIVSFLLCLTLLLSATVVFAATDNIQAKGVISKAGDMSQNIVEPEYIAYCPASPDGYHLMRPNTGGLSNLCWIENGKIIYSKYTLWKCQYCGTELYESTGYDVWAYPSDIYKQEIHYSILGVYYDIYIYPRYGTLPGLNEGYKYRLY